MLAISWLAKEQLEYQVGLRSVDLLSLGTIQVDTDHVSMKVTVYTEWRTKCHTILSSH
jgi:phosphoribosyl-AMP cyclohydrolase